MVSFYQSENNSIIAVSSKNILLTEQVKMLEWLFGNAQLLAYQSVEGTYTGPRKEMISPWSTNAVEITQNMGIEGIKRIEQFIKQDSEIISYDPMLQAIYKNLDQQIFEIKLLPEPVQFISDIEAYNIKEGLALSAEEIDYLNEVSKRLGRLLTDSEVFGFSQVNSEHCRHKIFNGQFIIDDEEMSETLFELIKKTSLKNKNRIISAYKDNCAFLDGSIAEQFAPAPQNTSGYFRIREIETVLSLKAETHNFPTTVEPFNGAATGSGGEIRDRLAGGKASFPIAGTAVYMTSYSRNEKMRAWEQAVEPRKWLYQTPEQILIKASNGASDFGNKFGQPLICGSVLTFEHFENNTFYGFDKVIMLAGGIGFAYKKDAIKGTPKSGDKIVVLGGDNYRIGMGGGAVSSVATGEFANNIELNAVQRSNPEMQKRVSNAIRAMGEADENYIISIHDHGAGGHLNCLSELVEATGGKIDLRALPIGDPTLSAREIVGNESQERMGLVIASEHLQILKEIADRERAPMYVVGTVTGDMQFTFEDKLTGQNPIDWHLADMFGTPPRTVLNDKTINPKFTRVAYEPVKLNEYLEKVLQLEAVACKDWLTNKVDRSVTGRIAHQQTAGPLQLPLNNCGVVTLDYQGKKGIATSIGHAPVSALINPEQGSRLSVAEALTNLVWAPIDGGLQGVSLSANWMWPAKNSGENARLYKAVKALSDFCIDLGINVPTGKDSLSMTQKYPDGKIVYSPGTVIVSTVAQVTDVKKTVSPVLHKNDNYGLFYIDFSKSAFDLGGSSYAQVVSKIGQRCATINDSSYFKTAFETVQYLIKNDKITAGHDVSAGGLIVTLLEMTFADNKLGLQINTSHFPESEPIKLLFSEKPAVVIQTSDNEFTENILKQNNLVYYYLGTTSTPGKLAIHGNSHNYNFDIHTLRDIWFKPSYLLDKNQSGSKKAAERYNNYKNIELKYNFKNFNGKYNDYNINPLRKTPTGIKAAIIREKGVNGDREMAWAMYLAGMDVKDVHMTDLVSGRETLEDVNMIVFVGGFSNSDVLGSAKGWAGAFLYNPKAKEALSNFYNRADTLSLGVCNGCQLMQELELIVPSHEKHPKTTHNDSHKYESGFVNVTIPENNSIMLSTMANMQLGVWVAHGEGKFVLPYNIDDYNIALFYTHRDYPANPNGSPFNVAGICSEDGRHLAMMPHLERSFATWQWPYYPADRKSDEITPWIEAFVNARNWIKAQIKK